MTTLKFTQAKIDQTAEGLRFSVLLDKSDIQLARKFVMEQKQRVYDLEIKEHREKRSLEANRYLWALLGELASVLGTTKEELYLQKVREYGIFKDFYLTEDEYKTFKIAWESLGTGWPTEQVDYNQDGERRLIRAYYGSSKYNTKQMSRLLDSVVEDCKMQGIETATDAELSLMKEEWGN